MVLQRGNSIFPEGFFKNARIENLNLVVSAFTEDKKWGQDMLTE